MSKDTGGPAFPKTGNFNETASACYDSVDSDGMTLRDYFAAKVLNGLVAVAVSNGGVGGEYPAGTDNLAKSAYVVSDAILKARGE